MDPASLTVIIGLPAMYLIFLGTMFVSIVSDFTVNGVTFSYATFLTPGIVGFQAVMGGTIGGSMLWLDRRYGMFSQILSGPFTRAQYLIGIILATTAASLIGAFVMIVISIPLGTHLYLSVPGMGLVLLNLIVGAILFCSLMLYVAAKVKSNQMYNSIQIIILFVINFVSDVFYPINQKTPEALAIASYLNPLTYITDGIRAGFGTPSEVFRIWSPLETIVLLAETAALFILAYRTYSRVNISTS